MACLYFIMGILSIPSLIFYASGNTVKEIIDNNTIAKLSLGNIGQSNTACSLASIQDGVIPINFSCEYGTLGAITNFG